MKQHVETIKITKQENKVINIFNPSLLKTDKMSNEDDEETKALR
jgi:hypothetical protein